MATCLYKDKPCSMCHELIRVGEVCCYEAETKGVHHFECEGNEPPGPDAYRLADELGYREIGWEEILSVLERGSSSLSVRRDLSDDDGRL